ncbi:hypothetical protein AciPR4_3536 [Terriglobus saanensis SP1PR4]|uniref:Uncharacterized protein n=1 Tax=Terriglobus saanensis (strain ATCC BAA-1853 / DSM 23119 / SP1PR4) TaxID=401053 RepID=E8UYS3_TERSS|nr:hypothetical protein AciPR4_3536 [Terriglobus saanensis SP1PR4]
MTLLMLNAVGAVLYVFAASRGGWAIPEERAAGIHVTTGEPFVWFLSILPIVTIFLVINLAWGTGILTRRHWQGGRLWLMAAVVWLGALAVDFAHH